MSVVRTVDQQTNSHYMRSFSLTEIISIFDSFSETKSNNYCLKAIE